MSAKQLPSHPDLEQLKRQAKELQQSANVPLHEAQTRLAREYGFASWNRLREEVEARTLEFDAAVTEFVKAATDERSGRAERILALHPKIKTANVFTALVLGDAGAVDARLTKDPALANTPGGPRGWLPIHYICHTAVGDKDGLADIARRLVGLGVDPNTRFPWLHHGVRRPVLWGASRQSQSLPLVKALLDAGADPNDGVTLPMAASAGDIPVLDALLAHGANVDQAWASDGSTALYAILQWSRTPEGALWLLVHGADPNAVFAENGETPLHVAARAWGVPMVAEMIARGAEINRRRLDRRTPYVVAELNNNREVAEWLLAHGASAEMLDVDRLVAACSRGDRAQVDALLAQNPGLRSEITDDHYIAFHQAAERNDVPALAAMLAAGFDPNRPDSGIGKTVLHSAAMEGWPDAVRVLLAHGASVHVRDREFNGPPLIWAAEGFRTGREGRDFAAVGKLLLAAGSPVEWQAPQPEPAEGLSEILASWQRA
jgi:ankyrin repeat protein